jgi:long-subunit acyl-CoA synthetase (AMP-forming)
MNALGEDADAVAAHFPAMPEALIWDGVATHVIDLHRAGADLPDAVDGFGQIIYTSGSTGQPKGVRHESGQIAWSAAALGSATGASAATDST